VKQELTFVEHAGYLEIKGKLSLDESLATAPGTMERCRKKGYAGVLIDLSQLEGSLAATERMIGIMEVMELYKKYLDAGGNPLRWAIVMGSHMLASYSPAVDLAEIEDLPFKAFVDQEQAIRWLEQDAG